MQQQCAIKTMKLKSKIENITKDQNKQKKADHNFEYTQDQW